MFACMTTRAVHLELVNDKTCTSDAFLMAFRLFASLRGRPTVCWSDCGTNFLVFFEDFCCDFKWLWNKPDASHQIGVVETLIKSVRKGLHASCKLKNRTFTEEQWRTFLSETTFIINGRPLYLSSNNIWESPPITPNDILMGHHLQTPSTRIRRKGQPQTSSKKYPRSSE